MIPFCTIQWHIQDFLLRGGGAGPWGGGADLQRRHFSVKMYVKTKELDPFGSGDVPGTTPRSANDISIISFCNFQFLDYFPYWKNILHVNERSEN